MKYEIMIKDGCMGKFLQSFFRFLIAYRFQNRNGWIEKT